MFSVKSYFYGKLSSANLSGADGARVYYIDNNGVTWASYYGSGSQTNSTFSITEHIADTLVWNNENT